MGVSDLNSFFQAHLFLDDDETVCEQEIDLCDGLILVVQQAWIAINNPPSCINDYHLTLADPIYSSRAGPIECYHFVGRLPRRGTDGSKGDSCREIDFRKEVWTH